MDVPQNSPGIPPLNPTAVLRPCPANPARDVARTIADRVLYALAVGAVVYLQLRGKLDTTIVAVLLVLVGLRPHNLGSAIVQRTTQPLVSGQ